MPRVVVRIYDAVGGPAVPDMGADGFQRGPTTPGEYVIAGSWPHKGQRKNNFHIYASRLQAIFARSGGAKILKRACYSSGFGAPGANKADPNPGA